MFYLLILSIGLLLNDIQESSTLSGAWLLTEQNGEPVTDQEYIKIYQDGYFAFGARMKESGEFIGAGGGPFAIKGKHYIEHFDFSTLTPEKIGSKMQYTYHLDGEQMTIKSTIAGTELKETWKRISSASDDLTRNWVITGRVVDGQERTMTPGARRTVKILSGNRFQWIAFNSETKEFSGTGGGTYSAKDGQYIEKIEFFSRDNSRVGASLTFQYDVKTGHWHHSGLSSKGDPIYEIWSPYSEAYTEKTEF